MKTVLNLIVILAFGFVAACSGQEEIANQELSKIDYSEVWSDVNFDWVGSPVEVDLNEIPLEEVFESVASELYEMEINADAPSVGFDIVIKGETATITPVNGKE